jgi:hypothetical protein
VAQSLPPELDWLEEPLTAVLRDLGITPKRLSWDGEYVWVRLREDTPLSVWIELEDRGEALKVELAYRLQEEVPETREAWGEARPRCPGHPHPAAPDLLDDQAWWVCPVDAGRIARIGESER